MLVIYVVASLVQKKNLQKKESIQWLQTLEMKSVDLTKRTYWQDISA